MKTAKEWSSEISKKVEKQDGLPLMPEEYAFLVKQIQLDAMKEGMRRAAEICSEDWGYSEDTSHARKIDASDILLASDSLTLKNL